MGTTLIVAADDLHRLLYNSKLLQVGKAAKPTHVTMIQGDLEMRTSDGHMIISDYCEVNATVPHLQFDLSPGVVKSFENVLRDIEGRVVLNFPEDGIIGLEGKALSFYYEPITDEGEVDVLDSSFHSSVGRPQVFALSPERFRKLSLVKPGDYPVDFKMVWQTQLEAHILLFKAGPTVTGALSILDREILKKMADSVDEGSILW